MSRTDRLVIFVVTSWCFVGTLVIFVMMQNAQRDYATSQVLWGRFSRARHCHVVSQEEHGPTGYLCDDGITYYRRR